MILVGLSGTGKTAIREQLAARLGTQSLGPDELTWAKIHDRVARGGVVECARMPGQLVRRLEGLGGLVVQVTAPADVRANRLRARGEDEATVTRRLAESEAITYEDERDPDLVVESVGGPARIAADLAGWIEIRRMKPAHRAKSGRRSPRMTHAGTSQTHSQSQILTPGG